MGNHTAILLCANFNNSVWSSVIIILRSAMFLAVTFLSRSPVYAIPARLVDNF